MNEPSKSKLVFLALAATLIISGLLPHPAHGMYDPKHGRWLQRDPERYVDGMNLHQYVKSRPTVYVDWWGRQATQPTTRSPGSGPSGSSPTVPDYDKIKKLDGTSPYVEWPEQANSDWHMAAAGKLTGCPSKLVLPLELESALREALRRSVAGKEIARYADGTPITARFEWGGALVFSKEDAEQRSGRGKESIRHRAYGPKEGYPSIADIKGSLPNGGLGFKGWDEYGSYHTHPHPNVDSTFSSSDLASLVTPVIEGRSGGANTITILRTCKCTRAVVALKSADWKGLESEYGYGTGERGYGSDDKMTDPAILRKREAEMIETLRTLGFCYYKSCDADQRTLGPPK